MTCYVAKKLKYDKCDYARFLGTGRSVYIQEVNLKKVFFCGENVKIVVVGSVN